MFGMLVVYCYKNVDVLEWVSWLRLSFIAGALVLGLHFWKRTCFFPFQQGTIFLYVLVQKSLSKLNVE